MGILDNIKKESKKQNSTKGFYFGATEAEGENKNGVQNFKYYFEDYLNVLPQLENGKFIFTGRKGAGKSAIAKYIKETADKETNSFADLVRLKDFEIEKIVQLEELSEFKNKESIIFEWLILIRLIKLILKNDEGQYTTEYEKLKKFIERNSGIVDIDKFQIAEIIEKKKIDVKFDVLKQVFPSFSKHFDKKTVIAPFYRLINPLREVVEKILSYKNNSDKEYWLLFDDLDINFTESNSKSIELITDLLRISRLYNTEIFKSRNAFVLIFIRDDIKEIIESHNTDTAKLFSSYEATLNWYEHQNFKIDENKTALKRFINKRIEQNFIANNISYDTTNPWKSLFVEYASSFQSKTSFKYIIDFTFYRPRDLVLFLKPIGEYEYSFPISEQNIKHLIKKYLTENFRELKNELAIYFNASEIQKIINILRCLTQRYDSVTFSDLVEIIENYEIEKCPINLIKILSTYGIIIPKDKSENLHFNYREESSESVNLEECTFATHKSIYNYFNQDKI